MLELMEGHLLFKSQKIIGLEREKSFFSLETDEETLIGNLNYLDPNYNFLGNSIGYSLYSSSNDKPNQGYENSLMERYKYKIWTI